jgi:hypothetical protein
MPMPALVSSMPMPSYGKIANTLKLLENLFKVLFTKQQNVFPRIVSMEMPDANGQFDVHNTVLHI